MENAQLIGLSRQIAMKRQMDVLANNLANMNTPGYKEGSILFEEHVMPVARMNGMSGQDSRLSYVLDEAIYRNFREGSFEQTGNQFDVAISGDGWLVAQTPEGERYTRNGQLKLDAAGQLVTSAGFPVLGQGGAITFGPEENGVEIAKDGTISTNLGDKDRLEVVRFENPATLKKEGNSLFSSDEPALPADEAKVMQGMVEKSNVQPISEMTRMIETVRAYTTMAQTLQKSEDIRRQAIEKLGTPAA